VLVDALVLKVREGVRVLSGLVAVGVSAAGYREILGLQLGDSESEASWTSFFTWLKRRGLFGVDLVVSDAHGGLVAAAHRHFQLTFAPYPKTGGWTFSFHTLLEGASWNVYVVDVIALGQRVAYAWTLSGAVGQSPEGWSTKSRISGVTAIHWWLQTPGQADAGGGDDADQ
jgi:hypothetical protein